MEHSSLAATKSPQDLLAGKSIPFLLFGAFPLASPYMLASSADTTIFGLLVATFLFGPTYSTDSSVNLIRRSKMPTTTSLPSVLPLVNFKPTLSASMRMSSLRPSSTAHSDRHSRPAISLSTNLKLSSSRK